MAKPDSKVSFVAESTTTTSEFEFKFAMEPPEGGKRPSMSPVSLKEAMLKVNEALHEHGAMQMSWPEAVAAPIRALQRFPENQTVQRHCVGAAGLLSLFSKDTMNAAGELGAVEAIFRAPGRGAVAPPCN